MKFLLLFTSLLATRGALAAESLRLNQIQVVGTHNSYHVAPDENARTLIGLFSKKAALAWDYSREPLDRQLDAGIRQFELDLFADPAGGLYAPPDCPPADPMMRPGAKILHVPGIDHRSTHPTFVGALTAINDWSIAHPDHVPIMILLELKDSHANPLSEPPVPFDRAAILDIEKEILSVFDRGKLITPDLVRGDHKTLRKAVLTQGWPTLDASRGKVLFCLDNEDSHRDSYLAGNDSLENRLLFVSVSTDHPAAAWMKRNNPKQDFAEIQKLVRTGFLVRTRADADTREARTNDPTRRDRAFASGAQFISTDFPAPVPRLSGYSVALPARVEFQVNPVSGSRTD